MSRVLLSIILVLAVGGGAHRVIAQEKVDGQTTRELKKQDTVPPATGRNLPEQAGTQEPSSKVQGTSKDPHVFVNGVLDVPGARTDVDTAPAKFSARSAADDQPPIAGYRLRHLTDSQRREIVQGLDLRRTTSGTAANDAYAVVGAEVPSGVAQQYLTPVPESLVEKFPELKGTAFMGAAGKVLLVAPNNSLVIGVLDV
ncbi:MAG: hypothetical protein K2X43_03440 [Hyphomonadaceae bacterium]|jgi:hypothetical protein|nr:hypothetical protein [Hyphomonadaceae bacterium]